MKRVRNVGSNTLGRTKFEKKAMTHRTQTANQVVT